MSTILQQSLHTPCAEARLESRTSQGGVLGGAAFSRAMVNGARVERRNPQGGNEEGRQKGLIPNLKALAMPAFVALLCSCAPNLKSIQFADDVQVRFIKRDAQYVSCWLFMTNWDARGDACRDFVLVNARGAELPSKDFSNIDRVKTFCSASITNKRCPLHPKSWLRGDGHCYDCEEKVDWIPEYVYQEQEAFWYFINNRLTQFEMRPAYPGDTNLKIFNPSTGKTFPWPSGEADFRSLFGDPITCTKTIQL
jgi:hypothetical protein